MSDLRGGRRGLTSAPKTGTLAPRMGAAAVTMSYVSRWRGSGGASYQIKRKVVIPSNSQPRAKLGCELCEESSPARAVEIASGTECRSGDETRQ